MTGDRSLLEELPGELIMWVLIVSELAVFCVCLLVFLSLRLTDPELFAQSQARLHQVSAGVNTIVLVSSGYLAARAVAEIRDGHAAKARRFLLAAAGLGTVFLALKAVEYSDAIGQGIGLETNSFFTFYFLLTGFHAAHVIAGIIVLLIVALRPKAESVEAGAQFWHMIDLVWVLLFPIIYLLQ
ncbi:cytochrome c oxidase subunit 3 [Paracoccus aerodenitrificans]|uniref:cytochrome c oxidase subunit 3 n=1 Tax=Paracoccus aerodenitrificans TaxID=3017781 RepID=UPI0022F0D1AA|nr:cytochrome c oxidase subunit 3 [Paracoccus aerodenitrificans]WBU62776.1 cytochrome c oxidase subunit 3 [Paracoccus aerodenitrificans]